jgi:hypothetical protein
MDTMNPSHVKHYYGYYYDSTSSRTFMVSSITFLPDFITSLFLFHFTLSFIPMFFLHFFLFSFVFLCLISPFVCCYEKEQVYTGNENSLGSFTLTASSETTLNAKELWLAFKKIDFVTQRISQWQAIEYLINGCLILPVSMRNSDQHRVCKRYLTRSQALVEEFEVSNANELLFSTDEINEFRQRLLRIKERIQVLQRHLSELNSCVNARGKNEQMRNLCLKLIDYKIAKKKQS